ncbi:hypothetical protein AAC387_Pa05g1024 [Persea americana]
MKSSSDASESSIGLLRKHTFCPINREIDWTDVADPLVSTNAEPLPISRSLSLSLLSHALSSLPQLHLPDATPHHHLFLIHHCHISSKLHLPPRSGRRPQAPRAAISLTEHPLIISQNPPPFFITITLHLCVRFLSRPPSPSSLHLTSLWPHPHHHLSSLPSISQPRLPTQHRHSTAPCTHRHPLEHLLHPRSTVSSASPPDSGTGSLSQNPSHVHHPPISCNTIRSIIFSRTSISFITRRTSIQNPSFTNHHPPSRSSPSPSQTPGSPSSSLALVLSLSSLTLFLLSSAPLRTTLSHSPRPPSSPSLCLPLSVLSPSLIRPSPSQTHHISPLVHIPAQTHLSISPPSIIPSHHLRLFPCARPTSPSPSIADLPPRPISDDSRLPNPPLHLTHLSSLSLSLSPVFLALCLLSSSPLPRSLHLSFSQSQQHVRPQPISRNTPCQTRAVAPRKPDLATAAHPPKAALPDAAAAFIFLLRLTRRLPLCQVQLLSPSLYHSAHTSLTLLLSLRLPLYLSSLSLHLSPSTLLYFSLHPSLSLPPCPCLPSHSLLLSIPSLPASLLSVTLSPSLHSLYLSAHQHSPSPSLSLPCNSTLSISLFVSPLHPPAHTLHCLP